jgi:hypothetical protein
MLSGRGGAQGGGLVDRMVADVVAFRRSEKRPWGVTGGLAPGPFTGAGMAEISDLRSLGSRLVSPHRTRGQTSHGSLQALVLLSAVEAFPNPDPFPLQSSVESSLPNDLEYEGCYPAAELC